MRLLLVEDDAELVARLKPVLQQAGYVVECSEDGVDGAFRGEEEDFDLVILDLGLPGLPGLEVLRRWRDAGIRVPVLILTARNAWHERVDGLKAGADDYLGKPFHAEELLARVEAIARRGAGRADNLLQAAGLSLDTEKQQVCTEDGQTVELTAIEFRLLRYMMEHVDRVLSKTVLSEHVYEEEQLKDSNVIEVYINRLRKRLGRERIQTRRGQGYVLVSSAGAS